MSPNRKCEFLVEETMERCLECECYSTYAGNREEPDSCDCSRDWMCDRLECPEEYDYRTDECRACLRNGCCSYEVEQLKEVGNDVIFVGGKYRCELEYRGHGL